MLIGDVTIWSAHRMVLSESGDKGVTADYAQRLSCEARGTIRWECRNGDHRDVRYFWRGERVGAPP